ncbi:KICSTOR complex protein ITFG2-like [Tribolium madens]|uniref:KICSTOR complex protein ITFG2-like n=1 Tax=Tribolium madens TaxID=41895 RepID=UPI001CF751D1|nr:KICSTOR complex protein ITFG2-like [Tribolium madens]
MRAISLVNRLEFQFMGNVARNAVTLGDIDNDGCNELIIGNNKGEVAVFKGKERIKKITDLSFVSCVAVGDIFNKQKNSLVIVTADGWCYIYEVPDNGINVSEEVEKTDEDISQVDGQVQSGETLEYSTESNRSQGDKEEKPQLVCVHIQRIPANAKNIVLGDIDNDGMIEMILGLTDRVVRSYRWVNEPFKPSYDTAHNLENVQYFGKLIALNKWECANQIGSITLHHTSDGKPSLLIAQPGGTFMRIRCQPDDSGQAQENLELSGSSSDTMPGSAIDYQFLGISRMRNQNISTEILGDFQSRNLESQNEDAKKCPYAVATLDGTIMLVQDEVILWAIAVDHQIFALCKLDVTGNGMDDIVVCSWDGQTYILDQEKNCVRFHLDEPVQAFHCGHYNLTINDDPVTCLVYITFKNTVIIYYDIPLKELKCKKYEPSLDLLRELYMKDGRTEEEAQEMVKNLDKKKKNQLIHRLLYNVKKS